MVSLKALAVAAAVVLPALAQQATTDDLPPVVPGAYIVEFAEDQETDTFLAGLGAAGQTVERRLDLKYDLFKGVSFNLKDVDDEETAARNIEARPEVRRIWPVRAFPLPKDEVIWTANENIAVPEAALSKRQDGSNTTFAPHVMTQIDKLRAKGIRGKGIRVAVIDTGIDYRHPALGGCFGPGCLVSFGTDLVGSNYTGFNTPVPDPDPYDNCEGHGTHVAGTIAAQNNPLGFTGAAPDVTLGAYRVFGCGGNSGDDVLIAAFNQAYQDGAQIITASIGGPSGWSEEPWAVAVSRIVEAGVPCTVSAGNSGDVGQFYASAASNGKRVMSIASVDNTVTSSYLLGATYTTSNSTTGKQFGWAEGSPSAWANVTLPLYSVLKDVSDPANACTPLPDDTPDLSGYIVLVRRGTCVFTDKVQNIVNKGGKYVMFVNNAAGAPAVAANVDGVLAIGMTTSDQGAEWVDLLNGGATVTLSMTDPAVSEHYVATSPNTATGGFLSTFTSWGPTYEVDVKQQFSAPGGIILSTYPLDLGGYAVLSGTSMACPLAAAVMALVAEVRGTFDPAELEMAVSSTANPQLFNTGATGSTFPYLAPVAQQGAGLIQAYDAAYTTTIFSVSSISFNDTDNFAGVQNFTIRNTGVHSETYHFSNIPTGTFYTLDAGSIYPASFPNAHASAAATVQFSPEKVKVRAGESAVITVIATEPAGLDATRLPVYSGYIAVNNSDSVNGLSLSLPYIGVAGSLKSATNLDDETSRLLFSNGFGEVPEKFAFSLPVPSNSSFNNTLEYPLVRASLTLGTAWLTVELREATAAGAGNSTSTDEKNNLGPIYGYPLEYLPRALQDNVWQGLLADGTPAPAGTYEMVIKALRVLGDRDDPAQYEEKVTVPFSVSYY